MTVHYNGYTFVIMNEVVSLSRPRSVSTQWLGERLSSTALRIVDVRCRAGLGQREDRSGPRLRDQITDPPRFFELGPRAGWARAGQWPTTTNADFAASHVPGAVFFDVARGLFDSSGTLVSAPELAMAMSGAGVGDEHTVVIVDDRRPSAGIVFAWALERYGHPKTFLLEGGFPRWVSEGRPTTQSTVRHPYASFTARTR